MQTTKDLSKTQKFFYRWVARIEIFAAITLVMFAWIGVMTSVPGDLTKMMVYPRPESYEILRGLMAVYLAFIICLTWSFIGIIRKAYKRMKFYTSE